MLFPARVKLAVAGLVVAGGGVAAALLGPAGPAVGQASGPIQVQIQVNSPGTLTARGAGADVSVTASCSGPSVVTASVQVSLTQRVGSELASGGGATTIDCTGTTQTVVVVVPANVKAYKKGAAIAQGFIQACQVNFGTCAEQQVTQTIELGG